VVCAVKQIEKSTLFGGEGGKCVHDARKLILLTIVSTLLSPIVVFDQNGGVMFTKVIHGQILIDTLNRYVDRPQSKLDQHSINTLFGIRLTLHQPTVD